MKPKISSLLVQVQLHNEPERNQPLVTDELVEFKKQPIQIQDFKKGKKRSYQSI